MIFIKKFLFFFIISTTLIHANQFAPFNIFKEFDKINAHEKLSNLYPQYANDDLFKKDIQTREEFLKKNPKVKNIIKISDLTKELGMMAWIFHHQKKAEIDKQPDSKNIIIGLKEFQDFSNKDLNVPENVDNYKDFIFKFFQQNFNDRFLNIKYQSERYIHEVMFDKLKIKRANFTNLGDKVIQPSKDDEWSLCKRFMDSIETDLNTLFKNSKDNNQRVEPVDDITNAKPFFALMGVDHYSNENKIFKPLKILEKILEEQRNNSENNLFLFRATSPFKLLDRATNKTEYEVLDAVWNEKENKYKSFSYCQSIFSNLFRDTLAMPLGFWTPEIKMGEKTYKEGSKMQMLQIPFDKVRKFTEDKFLFIPPHFGVIRLFVGGEFHERSGLPKICFGKDGITTQDNISEDTVSLIYTNITEHPKSHLLFNTDLELKEFEKRYFEEVWLPHIKILDDPNNTIFYKENMKNALNLSVAE